jgi:CDP-diacylglycerol--serine O-phosphatidyltransferase
LKVSSEFGAELDSLVDFINFGVAPSLVCYFFSLYHLGNKGWAVCLFFSACMVLRLARFNIQRHQEGSPLFSVGVPAPAGALLALMPLIFCFIFEIVLSPWIFFVMILFTSVMLISRYPTFVFKKIVIPDAYRRLLLIGALVLVVCIVSAPWETLLFLAVTYLLTLPLSGYFFYKKEVL